MVRLAAAAVVLVGLLVLVWMNLLRVNNLEHDVKVLQDEVARLKGGEAPAGGGPPPTPAPGTSATPQGVAATAPPGIPPAGAPAAPGGPFEARPARFLDEDAPQQAIPFTAGPAARGAEVTILAIEGDGAAERVLPEPITMTLQPGVPHAVAGICQGPPDSAAWVFTLDPGGLRITSRDCEYPVRGLRPRVRISVLR